MFRITVLENFKLGENHLGKAVFAKRNFAIGDIITQFTGPLVPREKLPTELFGENDRYVQVGEDIFMGPSQDIDDYINHSCDPNAGLIFKNFGVVLVAIKPIQTGDEIVWDYSTTLYNDNWQLNCQCGAKTCRKVVSEFRNLPEETKNKYLALGIVPEYIRKHYENHQ